MGAYQPKLQPPFDDPKWLTKAETEEELWKRTIEWLKNVIALSRAMREEEQKRVVSVQEHEIQVQSPRSRGRK